MRKVELFLCVAAVLLTASQASAVVDVDPNTTLTWNLEPTTVTATGGTTYNWNVSQIWPNYMYNTVEGDVVAVYPVSDVAGTADWTAGETLTVKALASAGKFLVNGNCENRANDNTFTIVDPILGVNARYPHHDNGDSWKQWIYSATDPNVNTSFRVSVYLVRPDSTGIHKNKGVNVGWKYPGADPIYPAFTDAQVPEGEFYMYAMTYQKDHKNVYDANYVDGVAHFLRNATFDASKEITFSAQIGKFPAALMAYNGYYLQIAVGGSEFITGQFQQGNGTPHVYEGTVIAETRADASTGGADLSWHTATVTYTPNPADAVYNGLPIQVRILVPELPGAIPGNFLPLVDIAAVAFDDCHVTIDGVEGIEVAPSTIQVGTKANTGEIATGDIIIYDDVCVMSRATGKLAGDLNEDCEVDLLDLGILCGTWLADPEVGPVALP